MVSIGGTDRRHFKEYRIVAFATPRNSGTAPAETPKKSTPERLAEQKLGELLKQARYEDFINALCEEADKKKEADPGDFCAPFRLRETWQLEQWKEHLSDAFSNCDFSDPNPNAGYQAAAAEEEATAEDDLIRATTGQDSRAPRVLGLVAGTGDGKTHALLSAGEALNAKLIYITYNLDQNNTMEKTAPKIAALLRVILVARGFSNRTCDKLLTSACLARCGLPEECLLKCCTHCVAASVAARKRIVLSVDECRQIGNDAAKKVASVLGALAVSLHTHGIHCCVVLSSLVKETWMSISSRDIQPVRLPTMSSGESPTDFVLRKILPAASAQQRSMGQAVAGHHFRSAVIACNSMQRISEITFFTLFASLKDRFSKKMTGPEQHAVREFAKASVLRGARDAGDINFDAQPFFTATTGAIPPGVVCHVFDKEDGFGALKHPAIELFECSAFTDPTKQLEKCSMHYDLFRALYGLPVVPHGIQLGKTEGNEAWFRGLVFPMEIAREANISSEALFGVRDSGCGEDVAPAKKTKIVARTAVVPVKGKYYLPSYPSHPWIDRAAVAYHKEHPDQACLVLYHDKINKTSFSDAVQDLNKAAAHFRDQYSSILCVACVVGATEGTRAQDAFEFPYLIVRDSEVAAFFTPTFAPAIRVLRERRAPQDQEEVAPTTQTAV